MEKIYIETTSHGDNKDSNYVSLPIESVLLLALYKFLNQPSNIEIIATEIPTLSDKRNYLRIKSTFIEFIKSPNQQILNSSLQLPFYVHDRNHFISGFGAVCREMIVQNKLDSHKYLLGFNNSCLQAPTEASSWTRFCEIEMTSALNEILENYFESSKHIFEIPSIFCKFENHLKKPLRINDKYSKVMNKNKNFKDHQENVESKIQFAEYSHPTLVDFILYLIFEISFVFLSKSIKVELEKKLPLFFEWLKNISNHDEKLKEILMEIKSLLFTIKRKTSHESIYFLKSEESNIFFKLNCPQKYIQISKNTTIQTNISQSLEKLNYAKIDMSSNSTFETIFSLDWKNIAPEIQPQFGGVPDSRLDRKKNQLKCLIDTVMSLAKDEDIIVDFCSGSGHLGIMIAKLLPKCKIIFLENKQFSLLNTKKRADYLGLQNCLFYQSNIDYFIGNFNIGISLHACGTATDVVLMKCIKKQATFISCPCCYGSISPMPHISYPLSKIYRNIISERDYLYLTHAADLSICLDGIHCMDVIDTDRKYFAEELGFKVVLTKLKPQNCTPKNRLLIGTKT